MSSIKGTPLPYLRAWREWRGMSQEELSRKAEVTPATISRLENGAVARFGTIAKLATALQITREQLMRSDPSKELHGVAA